jgi:molecular chaperone GrpE
MSEESQNKEAASDIPQENSVGENPVSNEQIERELEDEVAQGELSKEEQLTLEIGQWKDRAIRAIADLENYRKRMAKEKADSIRFGNQSLLLSLLPVIDSFNMGMMVAEKDSGSMIYMGMQMVQKQLDDFLLDQGVKTLDLKKGDVFDPNVHDAVGQRVSDDVAEGHIIQVVRKGYKMGERMLRPANVIVSGKEEADEEVQSGDQESSAETQA